MKGIDNSEPPIGLPDVDKHSCQLLGPTALIVQGLMGILVISSLVLKRHRERPKRPWRIWLFDVSKQIVGQLFVHVSNVLVSGVTSSHTSGNACVAYFLNVLIDTTLGVALIYISLQSLTRIFTERLQLKGFESGVYGDPPSFQIWIRQAALYLLSLTLMKVIVVTFLTIFPGVYDFGEWLLKWTWLGEEDDFQVIFVMGIFPIVMNIIQFWLIDSIVKASTIAAMASDIEQGTHHDSEPLFHAGSDDEDDAHPNTTNRRSHSLSNSRHLDTSDNHINMYTSNIRAFDHADSHSYPPSLSGSFSANVDEPRFANIIENRRNADTASGTLPPGSNSFPQTLPSATNVAESADWVDSWNDDDWDNQRNDRINQSDA